MSDPNYYAHLWNEYDKKPRKIRVLDSTLREGEQHPKDFPRLDPAVVIW